MDAKFYPEEILSNGLLPFIQSTFQDGHRFQQDNNPKNESARYKLNGRPWNKLVKDPAWVTGSDRNASYQSKAYIQTEADQWNPKILGAESRCQEVLQIHQSFEKSYLLLCDKEEHQDINIRNTCKAITTFFSFHTFSVIKIL